MPKTRRDLYSAIARKIGGPRGTVIRATLQQSIFNDVFRARVSDEEFAAQLADAERDRSKAFQRFFQIVRQNPRSWGQPN